ncbi:MAG: ADP-ribosylglycohydrolase family protein [Candidatus Caldatribacterium sp.]|nr:ADP-ribosylglycohydrolase family protein [Candidatus Caldatribacterium sp.]
MRPVRRETLAVLVAEEIRRDIVHGVFRRGDKLPPENELARILGVGRPTVREALRILEGEGWIQFRFGGGAYVMKDGQSPIGNFAHFQKEEMLELLKYELVQLEEEGKDVPPSIREDFSKLKEADSFERIEKFYNALFGLQEKQGYPYFEPSDWETIQKEKPEKSSKMPKEIDTNDLREKIEGAWLGRCIGCTLGKPVEGWPKEDIEVYLKATDSYPLADYFVYAPDKIEEGRHPFHPSAVEATRGNIAWVPRDDDIDYTILNLKLVQENGFDFTPEDVGDMWLSHLPYNMVYTAERQAYANLVRGLKPPFTATYWNPFREWIGAQIRADIFGYLAPGNPELAASLAYRDASLSHTKNGIYGEMFVAAAISAAFVSDDIHEVIMAGLSQVPKRSRLSEMVKEVVEWSKQAKDWLEVWEKVEKRYGRYHWVHTLPNLAYVLIALLFGEKDFRKTVSIAVMCGRDTDCNGATAGSIIGVLLGKKGIPEEMYRPFNGKVRSAVFGFCETRIEDLVEATLSVIEKGKRVF